MVRSKSASHILSDGTIDLEAWLQHLESSYPARDLTLIRHAAVLAQIAAEEEATESGESCLQQGLAIAEILADLSLDPETLAASIVYESLQYAELTLEDIAEQLNDNVAEIVAGTERMSAINNLSKRNIATRSQVENIRRMLIAMVDDIRVVLIKLAERLQQLRSCDHMPEALSLIHI